ncbi:MAG: nucleotidyl transferase AbiEii/AbiGii toxin family protein [Anaerolineales bacterium]|jgi:predicted nucleotidyltransferase component of viral defense system|nr:nucleotidyl transferase AbiEii/AbiGii toxin family protein [Anaerolineales bacterium]
MNKAMQLKARIKNLASARNIPAQAVLQSYMLERLLERIASSPYKEKFVLKGGLLIASLVGIDSRTTMDMDATVLGFPLSEETLENVLVEICAIQLDDDVTLTLNGIAPIRDDDEYGGFRAALLARYETINTPLKIDITTGDVITPRAVRYMFHSSFDDKAIQVWAYNVETILAEKVETVLRRSVLNTRPRDFYDVYLLSRTQAAIIDKETFLNALRATSQKRMSLPQLEKRDAILDAILDDATMRQRWERYARDNYYARQITFEDVMASVRNILL